MRDLEAYIKMNSNEDEQVMETRKLTRYLDEEIAQLKDDKEKFKEFIKINVGSFSAVREKTRYYFCKYLYYYLVRKVENYFTAKNSNFGKSQAVEDLMVFKGVTRLKRKNMSSEQEKEVLYSSNISCGELFDAFHYFYYEYVSLD